MKPSEQIKTLTQSVVMQRLKKAKGQQAASGRVVLMSAQEEQRALNALSQDPMTWVMAILTWLDQQHQTQAEESRETLT